MYLEIDSQRIIFYISGGRLFDKLKFDENLEAEKLSIIRDFLSIEEFGILPNKEILKTWITDHNKIIKKLNYDLLNDLFKVKNNKSLFDLFKNVTQYLQEDKSNKKVLKKSQYFMNEKIFIQAYKNFIKYMENEDYLKIFTDNFSKLVMIKTFNFLNFITLAMLFFTNVYYNNKTKDIKYIKDYIIKSYLGTYLVELYEKYSKNC